MRHSFTYVYYVTATVTTVIEIRADETSNDKELTVQRQPPKFTSMLKPMQANENEDLQLSCKVKGHPEPAIMWYYNGIAMKFPRDRLTADVVKVGTEVSAILRITGVKMTNTGIYECRARNKFGSATSKASLQVFKKKDEKQKMIKGLRIFTRECLCSRYFKIYYSLRENSF